MLKFIERIFGKKQPSAAKPVQTAPLSEEQLKSVSADLLSVRVPQYVHAVGHSVGKQRDHNEDTVFCLNSILMDGNNEIPFGIYVVADGMGGHQHGEVASGVAARAFAQTIVEQLYAPVMGSQPYNPEDSLQEIIEKAVQTAHQAVLRSAPGGGTTLTAAFILGEQLTVAHVGDSRAYYIAKGGRSQLLTQDHSLVRRLQDLGQLTEEEANNHPNRNVLYRALGQADPFRPDIQTMILPHPGALIICSDGLWGVIPEEDLFSIVKTEENPTAACDRLVQAANDAGGPDNISVIIVHYI